MEEDDKRLTQTYGTTMKAVQHTHACASAHEHLLIKTSNGNLGGKVLIRFLIAIPPTF